MMMSICEKLLPRKAANSGLSQTIQQYAFLPIGYTFEKPMPSESISNKDIIYRHHVKKHNV